MGAGEKPTSRVHWACANLSSLLGILYCLRLLTGTTTLGPISLARPRSRRGEWRRHQESCFKEPRTLAFLPCSLAVGSRSMSEHQEGPDCTCQCLNFLEDELRGELCCQSLQPTRDRSYTLGSGRLGRREQAQAMRSPEQAHLGLCGEGARWQTEQQEQKPAPGVNPASACDGHLPKPH